MKLNQRFFRSGNFDSLPPTARRQRGATLIEILVSVLILSFGLLGMASLQTRALQGNQSSVQRSQAIMLTQFIMDAMRVDRESAKGGSYNTGYVCSPAGFSGVTLAQNNMRDWIGSARDTMGVATDTTTCGSITCDDSYICTVRLRWDDSKAGGLSNQVLEIQSRL